MGGIPILNNLGHFSAYIAILKEIGVNLTISPPKKVSIPLDLKLGYFKKPGYTPVEKFGAIPPCRLGPCPSLGYRGYNFYDNKKCRNVDLIDVESHISFEE